MGYMYKRIEISSFTFIYLFWQHEWRDFNIERKRHKVNCLNYRNSIWIDPLENYKSLESLWIFNPLKVYEYLTLCKFMNI